MASLPDAHPGPGEAKRVGFRPWSRTGTNPCRVHRHSSDNYADDKRDDEHDSRMTGYLGYRARAGLREHVGLRRLCASPARLCRHVPVFARHLSELSRDTVATDAAVTTATATAIHDSWAAMSATENLCSTEPGHETRLATLHTRGGASGRSPGSECSIDDLANVVCLGWSSLTPIGLSGRPRFLCLNPLEPRYRP